MASLNSIDPEQWLRPEAASHMFKPTPEECCDTFFPGGRNCEVYNRGCKEDAVEPNEPVPPPPVPPPVPPRTPSPGPPPPVPSPVPPLPPKCVAPGWHPVSISQIHTFTALFQIS